MIHRLSVLYLLCILRFFNRIIIDRLCICHRTGKIFTLCFLLLAWLHITHIRVDSNNGLFPIFFYYYLFANLAAYKLH